MAFSVMDEIVMVLENIFMIILFGGALLITSAITCAITWGKLKKFSDFSTNKDLQSVAKSLGIMAVIQFILVGLTFLSATMSPFIAIMPYLSYIIIFIAAWFNMVAGGYAIKANLLIVNHPDYTNKTPTDDASDAYNASITCAITGIVGGIIQLFFTIYKMYTYSAKGGLGEDVKTKAEIGAAVFAVAAPEAMIGEGIAGDGVNVSSLLTSVSNVAGGGTTSTPGRPPAQGMNTFKGAVQTAYPALKSFAKPTPSRVQSKQSPSVVVNIQSETPTEPTYSNPMDFPPPEYANPMDYPEPQYANPMDYPEPQYANPMDYPPPELQ
jgi:hypothetical protein